MLDGSLGCVFMQGVSMCVGAYMRLQDLILQSVMEADKKGKAIVSELGDAAYRAIHGGLSKI